MLKKTLRTFGALLPRRYADAALSRGEGYYKFENLKIAWGRQDDYEILENIGRGKYSEVFKGINILNLDPVVVKVLKPVKVIRVCREIKILQNLNGGENIPKLLDVVKDYGSQTPSLILEYSENDDFKALYKNLKDFEVRFYIYEILKALEHAHSHGIMHRDVKPGNIMIDHKMRKAKLIDWGLAEFYLPKTRYNVRVASRYFKGPELLVGNESYDFSLDMWSLGATLAGIVFQKEPFFHGEDNDQVLAKIVSVLGTEDLYKYLEKYNISIDLKLEKLVQKQYKKPWSKFITQENKHLANTEAIDLVNGLLLYDHHYRLLPKEVMEHKYFDPVKEMWAHLDSDSEISSIKPYKETAEILRKSLKNKSL